MGFYVAYIFLVAVVYQGIGAVSGDAVCADVLSECASYGKVACHHPYQSWARNNCAKYCQFCGDKACVDTRTDCESYGVVACKAPYMTWATQNCARYCGICAVVDVPTAPAMAPVSVGCGDDIHNCASYGPAVCRTFHTWARQHCAASCGFCHMVSSNPVLFYNGTLPPNNNGSVSINQCYYKGKFYNNDDIWIDGCDFNCTCTDETHGRYKCSSLCYTWSLPSECSLVTPPGKCCGKPVCPPNFNIHYPPGYVDHDV